MIASVAGLPAEEVSPSATLEDDLELDPFDLAELLDELERFFQTTISDEALSSLRTVGDLERHLRLAMARSGSSRRPAGGGTWQSRSRG